MLTHPTLDQLQQLGLHGMAKGFRELECQPEVTALAHAEWLALLLDHEVTPIRTETGSILNFMPSRSMVPKLSFARRRRRRGALGERLTLGSWCRPRRKARGRLTAARGKLPSPFVVAAAIDLEEMLVNVLCQDVDCGP